MNFLLAKGIAPDRIRLSQAGPFEPQTSQLEAELAAQNSRVEVFMLGEFVDDFKGNPREATRRGSSPGKAGAARTDRFTPQGE